MPFHYRLGKMVNCSACSGIIHRDEPVSAAFSQEGKRSYYHKGCEEKAEYLSRWREEAAWAFRPVRLSVTEWEVCSPKKHLGVWQSIFIARRDEDIWCPNCGLKIARHEGLTCSLCGARGIVVGVEATKMVFTHRQPLYKLLVHCTEKGEDSTSYAMYPLGVARDSVKFFESYFGSKYNLPKLHLIAVPEFAAGAMENWGAITFREIVLLVDKD